MVHVSRRKALQMSGSGLIAGLAGCSALDGVLAPDPTLGEIEVSNLNFRPHTISVLVLDDEEPVYGVALDVPAAEPEPADSSDVRSAGNTTFEGFPTSVEDCVLYTWRDRQPSSQWTKFDFREKNVSCLGLTILIGDVEETQSGDVSILYTTSSNACEGRRDRDS